MLRLYVKNFAKHKEVRNPGCVTLELCDFGALWL
jgi:hypothetical protein